MCVCVCVDISIIDKAAREGKGGWFYGYCRMFLWPKPHFRQVKHAKNLFLNGRDSRSREPAGRRRPHEAMTKAGRGRCLMSCAFFLRHTHLLVVSCIAAVPCLFPPPPSPRGGACMCVAPALLLLLRLPLLLLLPVLSRLLAPLRPP